MAAADELRTAAIAIELSDYYDEVRRLINHQHRSLTVTAGLALVARDFR